MPRSSSSSSSSSSYSSSSSSRRHKRKKHRQRQQSRAPPPPPKPANENIILPEIQKALSAPNVDHHNISKTIFQTRMRLKIIQKKPVYVADSKVCIRAIFVNDKYISKQQAEKNKEKDKQQEITLNPINKLANKFYAPHLKPPLVFNCHDQTVQQQKPLYPSPYHPAFHYRSYDQFLQRRKSTNILVSCERIEVRRWSVAVTNISGSGYYGPVLMIHDYTKINGNQNLDKIVQNILFCKELSQILENFRAIDLRSCFPNKSIEEDELQNIQDMNKDKDQQRISFSYYVRDQVSNQKASKKSPHVNLDTKGSLIRNNQSLPISFIPLGNVQQFNIFKYPIKPKYLCRQKHINFNKFQFNQQSNNDNNSPLSSSDLDDQYEIEDQIVMREKQRNNDPIDEQQRQNINQENVEASNNNQMQKRVEQYNIESQSDDLSDYEDHLKKVYQKMLEKNNNDKPL